MEGMTEQVRVSVHTGSPARVRILFVAHDAQLHGAQLTLLNILRNLDRSRFIPFVVSPQSGPFTDEVAGMGIPVSTGLVMRWVFGRRAMSVGTMLRAPWKLFRTPAIFALFICGLPVRLGRLMFLLHRAKIDVVYTNTITVVDGAIVARLASKPHFWHLHENIVANEDLLKVLPAKQVVSYLVPKLSATIAVVSHALRKQIFQDPTPTPKVKVIHNGVDIARFSPRPSSGFLHRELGIPINAPLTGICGEIQESKGLEVFIHAAAAVLRQHPVSHFVIIGTGSPLYVEQISELIRQLRLTEKIHLVGWRADIAEIFRELQVLVIASKQEAFGLTAVEGMSTGLPVVATRCGGPEEVIQHGKTGYLVEIGGHQELAQRLVELLTNTELRHRLGQAGRARVQTQYDIRDCVRKIELTIMGVNAVSNN